MLKKSFFLSLAIHALLGAMVASLILFVHQPQPTIYIPLSVSLLHHQEKKPQTPACNTPKKALKHPVKKPISKPKPKPISKPKPKPKPKKIVHKKVIEKKIIQKKVAHKTIPLHKIKKVVQEKKIIAKNPPLRDTNTTHVQQLAAKQLVKHSTQTASPQHTTLAQANTTQSLHVKSVQLTPLAQKKLKNRYLDDIYQAINAKKVYPIIARKLSQTGTVKVSFTILKDGEIRDIKLKESSGFTLLDKAAQKILKKIAKVKPIPPELHEEKLQIISPIIYQLN